MARDVKPDDRLDPLLVRQDFPLLRDAPLAQGLHYLDNAATTHKPQVVIDAISDCYGGFYGPIHRGLYPLAEEASGRYERARARLATFLGAASADELVFTRSATEAINMVAWGWARERLQPGDRIWVSRMEHHANYLPWQRICRDRGAELRIIELHEDGSLDLAGSPELFAPQTRLIALCQVSNVLGVENPLRELCATARAHDIPVMVDAAQGVSHLPLDVCELGCDFLACSAHKMYGPGGIGLLYGRAERLQEMAPLLLGGGMVDEVGEGTAESTWTRHAGALRGGFTESGWRGGLRCRSRLPAGPGPPSRTGAPDHADDGSGRGAGRSCRGCACCRWRRRRARPSFLSPWMLFIHMTWRRWRVSRVSPFAPGTIARSR